MSDENAAAFNAELTRRLVKDCLSVANSVATHHDDLHFHPLRLDEEGCGAVMEIEDQSNVWYEVVVPMGTPRSQIMRQVASAIGLQIRNGRVVLNVRNGKTLLGPTS